VLLRTALATGAEEISYRGNILTLLLPRGRWAAALIATS
jgi:membrane protease YdiL (CAAX protease family)